MKITELKRRIAQYPEQQLQLIIAEMYKAMPKKLIEDKQIDQLLLNTYDRLEEQKKAKKNAELPDFDALADETETFIQHAYQQNYFAPNREIHKKDRPKWRFIVKRLTDQLVAAGQQPEHVARASGLLDKLYIVLCQASQRYLFNTDDPFNSVRIAQPDYFRYVLSLKTSFSPPAVWVREAIRLMLEEGTDPNTSDDDLIQVLLEFLPTPPLKELAVEQCDRLRKELEASKTARSKSAWSSDYSEKRKRNMLCLLKFQCWMRLCEYDAAIAEFKQTYAYASSSEVELYILLKYLYPFGLKELWVREYEAAVRAGVKPREQLQRIYTYIGQNGQFPEHFHSPGS